MGALQWEKGVALPSPSGQVINGIHHYTIDEFNYYYKPDRLTWHVGEKVELTIHNRSQSAPPRRSQPAWSAMDRMVKGRVHFPVWRVSGTDILSSRVSGSPHVAITALDTIMIVIPVGRVQVKEIQVP